MDKVTIARMNSYRRLGRLLSENATIFNDFDTLKQEVTAFVNTLNHMESNAVVHANGSAPMTSAKEEKFDAMEKLCLKLCRKAWSWAVRNNAEAAVVFNITSFDLRQSEGEQVTMVQNIYDHLYENRLALVAYRVTGDNLTELQDAISEARRMKDTAGNEKVRRSNALQELGELQADAELTLDIIQNLLNSEYGESSPDLVRDFAGARRVENPATRHTTLKGIVKDPAGNPVAGALCRLDGIADLETQTGSDGHYELKTFRGGEYVFMVTHPAYQPAQQNINIGVGDTRTVDVTLAILD